MRRGRGKKFGIPTGEPRPEAIDDYSGFKVHLDTLKKDWQGLLTQRPDIRNPQDYLRGIKDDQSLPYARPETQDQFIAGPIIWEDDQIMTLQTGGVILTEGVVPEL